jgi:hypothetical protein
MRPLLSYLATLPTGRAVLWCYLIWYLVMVAFHFDPAPRLWLTSLGISAVVGVALNLSVAAVPAGQRRDRWQAFRLFFMPFAVSSFSALVKDAGFILVFSPRWQETGLALALCALFAALVAGIKVARRAGASSVAAEHGVE